ncbi:Ig-like domain repeat protein [uncultured Methanobrevibacter sp.]|nr:Ig-like domain repeat protein [uncultured Methanobrevibacter sp.]
MTNSSFIVSKADISLRIEVSDKVYTADVTGKVFASVDGEYSVVINGNTIPVTVKNGSGEFNLGILKTGNYTITVIYNGTDNYKANTNKTTFKVSKSETNFNIKTDANNITYGDSLKITQTLPGDATGTITYTYANGTIIKVIKVGESFVLSNLDAGSYVIYGYYSGDSNYKSARDSLTITVNKAMNNIIVSGENTVYPENSTIKVIADIDGEYTVIISANKIIVNVINGVGIGLISLDAGKYIANIEYTNKNYENNIKSIAFNVAKANITLSVEVLDKVYTEDVDGNVFASVDGDYIVVIGDTSKLVSVKNGIGEFNLGILKTGNYKISVIFNGNENYNSNFKTTSFKVTETGTNFNIIANNTHITYGEDVKITQKLPSDATGTITYIFANGTVINIIKVGESFVLSNLDAGSYVIYGYYSGDSNYKSARDSLTITVNKAINNIIVSSENTVYPEKSTIKVKADIDGEYTVIISGKKIIVNVINGIGTSSISLDAGKYIANIEYTNKNYENNIKSIAFNVAKADVVLSVEVLDKVYTEDVGGNVFASVDGEYNIIINGNTILVTVKNGIGEFNLGILKAGDYSISVIYYGNKNYNSNYNTTSFKVTETGTNFNIIANNTHITYGEDVKITQELPGDATGTITYIFANGTVIKVIKVGESFVLSNLDAGSYVIYGYYSGDSNYKSAKDSLTIVVNPKGKENATISIDAPKVTEGENVTITVTLPADATGSVIATVNGKTYVAPVEKGTAIITIPKLDAGNYVIPVYYSGDDKYNSQSKNANVTVEEDKSDIISAPDVTKYFHGPERFIITVTDYKGNPLANKTVKLTINGVEYTRTTNAHGITSIAINLQSNHYDAIVTVDNKTIKSVIIVLPTVKGTDLVKVFRNATQYYATFLDSQGNYLREGSVVRFNINGVMYERIVSGDKGLAKLNINLEQGEYIITAMNLETGEMASNKITVIPRIIENNDLIKYYRNASQYTVKLIGDDGNPVGAGEEVTFNINGVFYTRTTNEFGIAKLNINLEPGQYIITAEYNGCKVSNLITVLPVLTAQDLSMKYHDGSKFFATLVDGQGKPYANQKIQYNINGVFYNRPTDNNGQSALNINLMPGEYIITSSYDECYISNKITISS